MGLMRRLSTTITVVALAGALTACATKRESALQDASTLTQATEQGEFTTALAEADALWANRLNKDDLVKAINVMERAVKMPAADLSEQERVDKIAETFERLSRAYYLYADSHLRLEAANEGDNDDEIMEVFEKGVQSAEKAIALRDPAFAKAVMERPNKWQDAVVNADPKALPALYWYATNLGKWALLEGIATILARKDDIKVTMDWAIQHDPNYFYGAPHRYFGVYHTKVPIGGGAPPKSKESFEASLAAAPNYLATKVLMAESYAVLTGDRALFDQLLTEVLAADPAAAPEVLAENTLEQRKAEKLRAAADDFFY